MSDEELVIPVRLEKAQASADLKALAAGGKQAGDTIAQGMRGASGATKEAGESARGFGGELTSLIRVGMGLAAIKNLAGGFSQEMERISERTRQAAKEFAELQKRMQGLSAMMGKENTNKFTLEQIEAGEAAGLSPQDWNKFTEQVQSKASSYLTGPNAKMSESEALKAQQKIAAAGALMGLNAEDSAGVFSDIVIQSKGKLTAADATKQAAQAMTKAQASSADPAALLRQAPRLTAAGFSTNEALNLMGPAPEWAPGEESTSILRVSESLRESLRKGTGKALGISKDQSAYDQIKTAVANLRARQAKGEDISDIIDKVAPEAIGSRGLRGLVNRADFQKWEGIGGDATADTLDEQISAGRKTEGGARLVEEAKLAASKARVGARSDFGERARMRAETALNERGELEHPGWRNTIESIPGRLGLPGHGSMRDQQINFEAISQERAAQGQQVSVSDRLNSFNNAATDSLLREMQEQTKLLREMADKDKRGAPGGPSAPPPIVLPPPMVNPVRQ
jgi:hypothetical protein